MSTPANSLKFGYRVLYYVIMFGIFFQFFAYPVYAMVEHFPYGAKTKYYIHYERVDDYLNSETAESSEPKKTYVTDPSVKSKNVTKSYSLTAPSAPTGSDEAVIEIFSQDKSGAIGYDNNSNSDDPSDNIFSFNIEKKILTGKEIRLSYDIYGIENVSGISRSINENNATGGYLVKKNSQWNHLEETISVEQLKNGVNHLLFTAFENKTSGYKVKNVTIKAVPVNEQKVIALADGASVYTKNNNAYFKGSILTTDSELYINNEKVNVKNNEFETFIVHDSGTTQMDVQLKRQGGVVYSETVRLTEASEAAVHTFKKAEGYSLIKELDHNSYGFLLDEVGFNIKKESYSKAEQITVQKLRAIDLAPLGTNIINVTQNKTGYRFLPEGAKFKENAQISVKFDKSLLPSGYDANDVKILYFDMDQRRWLSVPTDTIMTDQSKVVGLTDHFTDYIAGIIQSPESPETSSFTPTSISDIQVANPTANIMQVQPPTANQKGDGTLDFPITIPPGRNGLQPNLSVSYNNNGSSGIVGYGWDIAIPFISVDTKFGIPQYHGSQETESYLLNGEDLVMQNGNALYIPHRQSATVSRNTAGVRVFFPKVEGSFSKIERHGTTPSTYYWIVWDKSGTKYFYGQNANSRLSSSNGNRAKWMLEKVEDRNGNYIEYSYFTKNHNTGNLAQGKELLLNSITYNQNNQPGFFNNQEREFHKVDFIYGSDLRDDASISYRYGLKEINASKIDKIQVYSTRDKKMFGQYSINYIFNYTLGKFGKQLLNSITTENVKRVLNSDNIEDIQSYEHKFDYYDDVPGGNLFGTEQVISAKNDYNKKLSVLGGTIEKDLVTGSINVGGGVFFPGLIPSYIPISLAGTFSFNFDLPYSFKSTPTISLLDIDGDGLADKVMKFGNDFKYRKNLGGVQFSEELYSINHFKELSSSTTRVTSKPSISVGLAVANVGFSNSESVSESNIFLADVNADGLVDFVKDRIVYFNRLDPVSKQPTFTTDSGLTPNRIFKEGDVDPSVLNPLPDLSLENDLMDVVKVWTAPKKGTVNINGIISKQYVSSDKGVRYSVEKSGSILATLPFNENLSVEEESQESDNTTNNFVPIGPINPIDIYPTTYLIQPSLLIVNPIATNVSNVQVSKGDQIYFRVNSAHVPSETVNVFWDPEITYTTENFDSPNQYKQYSSKYSDSFVYGNTFSEPTVITKNGNYNISWDNFSINNSSTIPELSDDVTIKLTLYKTNEQPGTNADPEIIISGYPKTYTIKRNVFNTLNNPNINLNLSGISTGNIGSFHYLKIEVLTDSQINWKNLDNKFKPRLVNNTTGEVEYLKPLYKTFPRQLTSYYKSTFNTAATINIKHNFVLPDCTQEVCKDQYIYLIAKYHYGKIPVTTAGSHPAKFRYKVNISGVVTEVRQHNGTDYAVVINPASISQINVAAGNSVYFEYYTETFTIASKINKYQNTSNDLLFSNTTGAPKSTYSSSSSNLGLYKANIFYSHNMTGFGTLYRNWGQFAYKGAKPSEDFTTIKRKYLGMNKLVGLSNEDDAVSLEEAEGQQDMIENTDPDSIEFDPDSGTLTGSNGVTITSHQIEALKHFTLFTPDRSNAMWKAHNKLYVKSSEMSPFLRYDTNASMAGLNIQPPQVSTNSGAVSIVRQSTSSSTGKNRSIGFGFIGIGDAKSSGESSVLNDYRDVNGDGYPDIIGSKVQLTSARGGLSNAVWNENLLFKSTSTGSGKMVSGSPSTIVALPLNGRGDIRVGSNTSAGSSLGANGFETITEAAGVMLDINGDGLADKVLENGNVGLNNNGSFLSVLYPGYGKPSLYKTKIGSISGSIGAGYTDYYGTFDPDFQESDTNSFTGSSNLDFSVGMTGSRNATVSVNDFMDFNGDGLVDYVDNGNILFNTGTNFVGSSYSLPSLVETNVNQIGFAANLSVLIMIPFAFIPLGIKFGGGGGASKSNSYNDETIRYIDFDGDGYLDMVRSDNEESVKVRLSNIRRTNMLKMVHNPTGSKIELDYASYNKTTNTQFGPTYKMPFKKWVLSNVRIHDGFAGDGEDIQEYAFEYKNGYKDRRERKFLGFGEVKTYKIRSSGSVFRTTVQEYVLNNMLTNEVYLQGIHTDIRKYQYIGNLIKKESVFDNTDRLLTETTNEYIYYSLGTSNSNDFNTSAQTSPTYGDASRILPLVKESKTIVRTYQNSTTDYIEDVSQSSFRIYDEYGNLRKFKDVIDNVDVDISYHYINTPYKYIVNLPSSHLVHSNSVTFRKSGTEVDANGNVTAISRFNGANESKTNYEYNFLGNVTKVLLPKPKASSSAAERLTYEYKYDVKFDQFVTNVTDSYQLSSQTEYSNFGMPVWQDDANGERFEYDYDATRRLNHFKGPYNKYWTIKNYYKSDIDTGLRYAVTQHNLADEITGNNDHVLHTSSFADGLGRIIQTKKQIESNEVCGVDQGYRFATSGLVQYDEFGRPTVSYLGQEELNCGGNFTDGLEKYTPLQHSEQEKSQTWYDSHDRVVQTHVYGLNATTKYEYGFDVDGFGTPRSYEKVMLPEGNISITFKDHKNRVTSSKQVDQFNGDQLTTKYVYNVIGELLKVVDAEDKETNYQYDLFGQKVEVKHPDNGISTFKYDLTGKVIETANQKLINNGETINYSYNFNRLQHIQYPSHTVLYKYGSASNNPGGGIGRITSVQDLTGVKSFKYGALGEVIEENRSITTQGGEMKFSSKFRYDSWGRILEMIYPDGEELHYGYNSVGQLKSIVNTDNEVYLKDVSYNFFDQPTTIVYGNDVVTTNEYDITQRVRAMQLNRPDESTLMRNVYSYDRNQNITEIKNDHSQHDLLRIGGLYNKHYYYDAFNRLEKANGFWKGFEEAHQFDLSMKYNKTHGIRNKNQYHHTQTPVSSHQTVNSYQSEYHYNDAEHPHAVTDILYSDTDGNNTGTSNFKYDANGNMQYYTSNFKHAEKNRQFIWDEQNRLQAVIDGDDKVSHYVYDHAGERTFKSEGYITSAQIGGQNIYSALNINDYVIYPSGTIVVNPSKNEYSKHYYINSKRFVSRLGKLEKKFTSDYEGKLNKTFATNTLNALENNAQMPFNLPEVNYLVNIGNDPANCTAQLQYILSVYQANNNSSTSSLQHCIDHINDIISNNSPCDALVLVHAYQCIPQNPNVPDPTPNPVFTIEQQQEFDCLTELNILVAVYNGIALQSGYSSYALFAQMQILSEFTCDDAITYDCCKRFLATGVWDCPRCPDLRPGNCNSDGTVTPGTGTDTKCDPKQLEECCKRYKETGVWNCPDCPDAKPTDCKITEPAPIGCTEGVMYDCCKRYQATGIWDCKECPTLRPEDCGRPIPGQAEECYNKYLNCIVAALQYIQENLVLEPQSNACQVYEYVRKNFDCKPCGEVDKDPEDPEHVKDDWKDEGGSDVKPEEEEYDEEQRKPIWWYHTDHLGSSTYLTDNFGRPSHYYETLPFGEMMVEHNQSAINPTNNGYDNKWKFNGKELDDATGMYYYGARYYDPRISIFVSVDPLAEQTMEPYLYVSNNPINFIDPTGMYGERWEGGGYGDSKKDSDKVEPPVNLFKPTEKDPYQRLFNNLFNEVNKKGNYKEGDGKFSVYGHGGVGYINNHNKSWKGKYAESADLFDEMMSKLSPNYVKYAKDRKLAFTLTLYSCNSGLAEGDNLSIAEKISKAHPNATIIGFQGLVFYGTDKSGKPSITKVANYIGEDKSGKPMYDQKGYIVTFKKGVLVKRQLYSEYLKNKK